ncbi:MAG: alpha/beta family hydrolase [Thiohalocapsa sp.]
MSQGERVAADGVSGFLHLPATADTSGAGIVLTHGAGGNCSAPLLVAAAERFTAAGLYALRIDLPFRQRRPKGPPSPSGAAADRAGLRSAIAALRQRTGGGLIVGGQSYGGRQASLLLADEPQLAAMLLLFSYPLHPPGKPERRRTDHFARLRVPALFVHGSADPFGTLAELEDAIAAIPAPTGLLPVDGAGHDLRRGRFDLAPIVAAALALLRR